MSATVNATMCDGVVTAQYSHRLFLPQPNRPRPTPPVRCKGVRVQPTAAGLRRPSGVVRLTGAVISRSVTRTGLSFTPPDYHAAHGSARRVGLPQMCGGGLAGAVARRERRGS